MLEFIISKMKESTFSSNEEMYEFLDYDYKIIGDKEAFVLYYQVADSITWVQFLWASDKRKMVKVVRQIVSESVSNGNTILFDCDDFSRMFGNHARKIYQWVKEV